MNLETNLIFLIVFGILGYIVQKIWNFNPYHYYERFGAISLIVTLVIAYLPAVFNPQDVGTNLDRLINWFITILPGTIVGDIAGQIVYSITGERDNER